MHWHDKSEAADQNRMNEQADDCDERAAAYYPVDGAKRFAPKMPKRKKKTADR